VDCVLITGAAGAIGRALRQGLHGRVSALRLLDVAPLGAPRPGEELVTVDIRDLHAVTEAMEGVDATVHLAGIPHEDSFDRILETNVVGTYNVYEAARTQGCPRVVDFPPRAGHRGYAARGDGSGWSCRCWCSHSTGGR
jgi:uronate dehydrogenase